jgi:hypothetical protein
MARDELRNWHAQNWDELVTIWDELLPDFYEAEDRPRRVFRGRELHSGEHGFVFERWVQEAFRLSGADVIPSMQIPLGSNREKTREELDGIVVDGWQAFLLETKAWKREVNFSPLALFQFHVETRPAGMLGLFFSLNGYTQPALELAAMYRPQRLLLFDGPDFHWLRQHRDMLELVRRKWTLALQGGLPYLAVGQTAKIPSRRKPGHGQAT